jgi:hypothetical protein
MEYYISGYETINKADMGPGFVELMVTGGYRCLSKHCQDDRIT